MRRAAFVAAALIAGCNSIDGKPKPARPPARLSAESRLRDVVVSWSPVEGASGYTLHVSSNAGWAQAFDAATESRSLETAATSVVVASLGTSQAYWFSVTTDESGDASRPVSASVPAPSERLGPARWDMEHYNGNEMFGAAIAGIGDVNGDGYGDVAVGSTMGQAVRRFFGAPFADPVTDVDAQGADTIGLLGAGRAIGALGDVDGDGFDELGIGAPDASNGGAQDGRFVVAYGESFFLGGQVFDGNSDFLHLGAAAAGVGDRNADGFDDFVVSAPGAVTTTADVFFVAGAAVFGDLTLVSVASGPAGSELGKELANIGDVDGDGKDDLVVAQPGTGEVFVFTGDAFQTRTTIFTAPSGDLVIAAAGDVDGDGFPDVLAGSDLDGAVRIFPGPFDDPYTGESRVIYTCTTESTYAAVRTLAMGGNGDMNGDGFADVLVGDPYFDPPGAPDGGRAMLFLGGPDGLEADPVSTVTGAAGALLGSAVAFTGDMDRDGFDEVGIGAAGVGEFDNGELFLYQGHAAHGLFVDAGLPVTVRAGVDVKLLEPSFRDPFGMGPYSVTWEWGDGSTSIHPDPDYPCDETSLLRCRYNQYLEPGRYAVKVTVVSADGRSGEGVTTIEVLR